MGYTGVKLTGEVARKKYLFCLNTKHSYIGEFNSSLK